MSAFKMPEGVELALNLYLIGLIEGEEVEIVVTVGGLTAFSDDVVEHVELDRIISSNNLNDLGSDWRIMTRDEIKDYKMREQALDEVRAP